ncbi:alkylation response protein AidB-like acyl-CoA dehydrogenase [Antricoccus suffuscus]|uniref:Alkylation response protein AidB-like acyl-CoA dehydrogenase n=1 Tax=Antricoccus suffuscus TaxID=1629062 RepID=A0A2T1A6M2_9ACTN|nr:acyl-CoA dehydrogenase family protein [Antricoccus suffuscus]PRZ44249.1 alkylation response protein AidB-like acyl-CoA dehydrogenase [Antricoccus suffuscus]
MSLAITQEQQDLTSAVRRYLANRSPLTRVREVMDHDVPHDPEIWRGLADLGVHGLAIPTEYGGSGVDASTLSHVMETIGRALLPGPWLATLGLAVPLLLASEDANAMSRYLPAIAEGQSVATVGWLTPGCGWEDIGSAVTAREVDGRWRLNGKVALVLDAPAADVILVVASSGNEISVFAVDAYTVGVSTQHVPALDCTRGLGDVTLTDTEASLVGKVGGGAELLERAREQAYVLLAAEMVGGAQACLDSAVGYALQREQFGRSIASFQAIKHKCAEIQVDIEGARSCARYAAWACGNSPAEVPYVAALAKASAADAFFHAAAENIQIHGGIGFTWEHDAHLYFKRAKADQLLFGDTSAMRLKLADQLFGPTG